MADSLKIAIKQPKQTELNVFLKLGSGGVDIMATDEKGSRWAIATLMPEGIKLYSGIRINGLNTDADGRVVVNNRL